MRGLRYFPRKSIVVAAILLVGVFGAFFGTIQAQRGFAIAADSESGSASPSPSPSGNAPEGSKGTGASSDRSRKEGRASGPIIATEAAIEDIRKAREEIETKQRELAAKEADLKAKEQALSEEIKKLGQLRDLITKTQAAQKKESEEKVGRLVETLLAMSAKAASRLLGSLDENLAVAVMSQMETQRLGKILNVMETRKSAHLSELMAGILRKKELAQRDKVNAGPR